MLQQFWRWLNRPEYVSTYDKRMAGSAGRLWYGVPVVIRRCALLLVAALVAAVVLLEWLKPEWLASITHTFGQTI